MEHRVKVTVLDKKLFPELQAQYCAVPDSGQEYAKDILRPLKNTEDKIYRMIGEGRLQAMTDTLDLYNLLFERELNGGFKDE